MLFALVAVSCQRLAEIRGGSSDDCEGSRRPIIAGAADGDEVQVVRELEAGVDPDVESAGETALTCAAANHDLAMMTLLLDNGATPSTDALHAALSIAGPEGFISADAADLRREDEAIGLLLDRGADGKGGAEGPGPLLTAAWSGRPDTVALLLRHGADPDHGGRVDASLLVLAQSISPVTDETIPEGLAPEPLGETVANVPPLVGAAWEGHLDIATQLLDAGADPDLASDEAFTPILAAALRGDAAMVELLLDRGASPAPTVRADVLGPAEAAREAGHDDVAALLTPG